MIVLAQQTPASPALGLLIAALLAGNLVGFGIIWWHWRKRRPK